MWVPGMRGGECAWKALLRRLRRSSSGHVLRLRRSARDGKAFLRRLRGTAGRSRRGASSPLTAVSEVAGLSQSGPGPSGARVFGALLRSRRLYAFCGAPRPRRRTGGAVWVLRRWPKVVVARYGGVVEKFIGDAVMAVWGAPVTLEDDAERAVRAGLELVSAVSAYGSSASVELAARAGVATGSVATVERPGEGLVTGDRVNTAARIQATARPGCCYVDAATRRLSAGAIAFDDAGSHALKGKSAPEQLFRAVRVISGVGGHQRPEGPEAPLIGRDVELHALKELFHVTVERRSPRLVVISGPARRRQVPSRLGV